MLEYPKATLYYLGNNKGDETMDNQQRSLQERLAWLGGIIDGEGCFDTGRLHNWRKKPGDKKYLCRSSRVGLDITNTDGRILNECIDIFRELNLPHYISEKTDKRKGTNGQKYKKIFKLTVYGYKRLLRVLPMIIPYLVGKKFKAETMLELCESRSAKNKGIPWTDKEVSLVEAIRNDRVLQKLPQTTMTQPVST